jgi:IS30 family transposase
MARGYQHLSAHERDRLAAYRGRGWGVRAIARALHRTPSTISRELKRNAAPVYRGAYGANRAHARARQRARRAVCHPRLRDPWVRRYVTQQLRRRWSPELIAGRLRRLRPAQAVSHETIYAWVYTGARWLIPSLARAHRRRKRRGYSRRHKTTHIPGRIGVAARPVIANRRGRLGDWEADTMITRHGAAALQVLVDRRSRYTRLNRLPRRTARRMRSTLTRALSHLPPRARHTVTYDNGSENAEHLAVNAVLGTRSFFCTPYTSQERGTVENTAGLIRRFFPKRTNFAKLRHQDIKAVERWLNHRPRRVLDFQTPAEVFRLSVALRA